MDSSGALAREVRATHTPPFMFRRTSTHRASALALALLTAASACGDGESTPDTDVTDTGADVASDASVDIAVDSGRDAATDTPVETDVSPDVQPDVDVSPDAPLDVAPDTADTDVNDVDVDAAEVDTAPTLRTISGTMASALQGRFTWLDLSIDGEVVETLRVATTAESFAFETMVADGSEFAVTVADHPYTGACTLQAADGVVSDDMVVAVRCWRGYLFTTMERSSDSVRYGTMLSTDDALHIREVSVRGLGEDGLPLTEDDEEVTAREHVYVPDARDDDSPLLAEYSYIDAGPDGEWWTADDGVRRYETRTYIGDTLDEYLDYEGPGDDGEWFTADDLRTQYCFDRTFVYDGDGRLTCSYEVGLGADRELGTDDDSISGIYAYSHEAHPTLEATIVTTTAAWNAGDDGLPCTEDDATLTPRERIVAEDGTEWDDIGSTYHEIRPVVARIALTLIWRKADGTTIGGPDVDAFTGYRSQFRFLGIELPVVFADDAGEDGEWFTEDDRITGSWDRTHYDDDGNILVEAEYNDEDTDLRGPDGIWFTADDLADRWMPRSTNADGTRCVASHTEAGTDGLWDDAPCGNATDDAIEWVDWQTFDTEGRPVLACRSDGAGDDGVWATEDDELVESRGCVAYHYDAAPRVYRLVAWDFGGDDLPFTEEGGTDRYLIAYDENGFVRFEAQLLGGGEDDEWFTEDDAYYGYYERTYDRSGNVLSEYEFDEHGPDGTWFTEDDFMRRGWEGHMTHRDFETEDDG